MIDKEKFIAAREKAELSQKELANKSGCSQQLIGAIETGATVTTKFLPRIAAVLSVQPGYLDSDWGQVVEVSRSDTSQSPLPKVGDPYGPRDFQIFSAAEGGPGEIVRSPDPVDWWPRPIEVAQVKGAYGMYIVGESMFPEFETGQVAVINPNLPHVAGKPYIFYAETESGVVRATVKRLRRQTADHWHVTQHNPPQGQKNDFTLSKNLWRLAHRIVGRQDPS